MYFSSLLSWLNYVQCIHVHVPFHCQFFPGLELQLISRENSNRVMQSEGDVRTHPKDTE